MALKDLRAEHGDRRWLPQLGRGATRDRRWHLHLPNDPQKIVAALIDLVDSGAAPLRLPRVRRL